MKILTQFQNLVTIVFISLQTYANAQTVYPCLDKCECTLTSEISVDCRQKHVTEIPSQLATEARGVNTLDLSQNDLVELEANAFHELSDLRTLDMSGNDIDHVSEATFNVTGGRSSPIQYLDMSNNHLHFVPSCFGERDERISDFGNLKVLLLAGNLFGSYLTVDSFNGIGNVEKLDLSRNFVRDIPDLSFKALVHLKELVLSDNRIPEITYTVFPRYTGLQIIRADINEIKTFPRLMPDSLQEFYLSQNQIGNITRTESAEIQKLNKLRVLDLSKNKIEFVYYGAFSSSPYLQFLDLSENLIKVLPKNFLNGASSIEVIFLQNNPLLTFVSQDAFANLPHLQYLLLFGCSLKTFSVESRDKITEESTSPPLKNLWLFGNPINCNCAILPLIKYVKSGNVSLDSQFRDNQYGEGLNSAVANQRLNAIDVTAFKTICVSPLNRHYAVVGKPILEVPETRLSCPDEPIYVLISIFLGIISFAASIPVVFCLIGLYLLILKFGKTHFGWDFEENDD